MSSNFDTGPFHVFAVRDALRRIGRALRRSPRNNESTGGESHTHEFTAGEREVMREMEEEAYNQTQWPRPESQSSYSGSFYIEAGSVDLTVGDTTVNADVKGVTMSSAVHCFGFRDLSLELSVCQTGIEELFRGYNRLSSIEVKDYTGLAGGKTLSLRYHPDSLVTEKENELESEELRRLRKEAANEAVKAFDSAYRRKLGKLKASKENKPVNRASTRKLQLGDSEGE